MIGEGEKGPLSPSPNPTPSPPKDFRKRDGRRLRDFGSFGSGKRFPGTPYDEDTDGFLFVA